MNEVLLQLGVGKKRWLIKNRVEPFGSVRFFYSFLHPKNRNSNLIEVVKSVGLVLKKNEKPNRLQKKIECKLIFTQSLI